MKYADKLNAKYLIVLGDDEIKSGTANLKNMETGRAKSVALCELCTLLKEEI